jgi:HAMP domain-containing protein
LWILWWIFSQDLGTEFAPAFYTLKGLLGFLVPALVFCLFAVLLTAAVAVFAVAVFASHKLAGPLFRLQRVAAHLEQRVLVGNIHLRGADQCKLVASAINGWVENRKRRLASLSADAAACESALAKIEEALVGSEPSPLPDLLEALRRSADELQNK